MPRTKAPKAAPIKKVTLLDKTLELPEHITDVRQLRIQLDRKVLGTVRNVTDHLVVVRDLVDKDKPENLTVADPLVIYLKNIRKNLTAEQIFKLVAAEYKKRAEKAARDAAVIAMTWNTETGDREPEPFDEEEPLYDGGDDEPAWFKKTFVKLPEPEADLTDPYEGRLNVILNLLNEAGREFTDQFESVMNNDMLTHLDDFLVSEGVDLSQFQLTRAGK